MRSHFFPVLKLDDLDGCFWEVGWDFWARSRSFASLRMTNLLGAKKQIPHFVRDVIRSQDDMREVVAG
jgi:hypothetical protein